MNDDLKLLITFISNDKTMIKVAVKVEHGMNKMELRDYEYFREPDTKIELFKLIPFDLRIELDYIVAIEEIYEVIAC